MSSASHLQPSALDYRLESINSFHNRTSRGGHADMQQESAQSEQQQQHQGLPWPLQAAKTQRMQQRQSSAMTGPSLPQGFTDAPPATAARPAVQNLPPIFSPHLFAFNDPPQGQHTTVTSGRSLPETARVPRQQGAEGSLKDNLPLAEEPANARANALGSLNSATGFSPAPTHIRESAHMLQGLNVDMVVKMAPASGGLAATVPGSPAPDDRGRQQMRMSPAQASELRHVSSAESREFQTEGFTAAPTSPDATSGPATRTKRRAASGRPKYKDYFTDDASLSESALLEDDDEDEDDDDFLSEISMREGHYGMQSRNSSLQSADASHFKSSGMEGEEGRSSKRSAAAKKPRTKQLLCEQDPEAPGLTLDQRRKIRRRINNRASARRVRQKREEDLHKITNLVSRLDEERSRVMARASQFQSNCMQLAAQLKETRDRWQSTCATNAHLQRELLVLRAQVSEWQKSERQQSAGAQQPAQALQHQGSVGGPPGPGTPRVPAPVTHGNQGSFAEDGSLDLGSFLAN